ncbi:MAG TPA: amidohydrolase family protein [Bryobacteraceae bacterium]|nr:amidohydrolase family protein [Bryobacteraceae bacterium]
MSFDALSRRAFLERAGAAGMAPVLGAQTRPAASTKTIDCHAHLYPQNSAASRDSGRQLVEAADKLGIDQLCCSMLTARRPATADQFRECNRQVAESTKRFPGRILGYVYVNPGYTKDALDDIRRCVEERGFMGVKLYNEYWIDEPVLNPLVELTIKLRIPILTHAGHMHYYLADQPRISDGSHIAKVASRYPEATIICGHVGGGGDWEWEIKSLRNARTVYLDTSGSVIDEGMIEMAVATLGADRVVFGCDMSMTAGVGKMRSARISESDRAKIMGGNMAKIMARRQRS